MKCIITDDEPLARLGIIKLLNSHKKYNIVAQCKNAQELQNILATQEIDLVFLDLEMPVLNGMDFLKENKTNTAFIITTAYHQFATQSYEFNVLDYLIKPIGQERFDRAIQKADEYFEYTSYKQLQTNYIFLKCDKQIEKIYFDEIQYIQAMGNYVVFYMLHQKLIHYSSISSLLDKLPHEQFVRIQKSYIINIKKISSYNANTVTLFEKEINISRELKKVIAQILKNQL